MRQFEQEIHQKSIILRRTSIIISSMCCRGALELLTPRIGRAARLRADQLAVEVPAPGNVYNLPLILGQNHAYIFPGVGTAQRASSGCPRGLSSSPAVIHHCESSL